MIVADANLLILFHLGGEISDRVRIASKREEWTAPVLWKAEVCSGLIRYFRAEKISLPQAVDYFRQTDRLLWGRTFFVDQEKVIELTAGSPISPYDAHYIVLAQALGLRVLTLDEPLVQHFPEVAIHLDDYLGA